MTYTKVYSKDDYFIVKSISAEKFVLSSAVNDLEGDGITFLPWKMHEGTPFHHNINELKAIRDLINEVINDNDNEDEY